MTAIMTCHPQATRSGARDRAHLNRAMTSSCARNRRFLRYRNVLMTPKDAEFNCACNGVCEHCQISCVPLLTVITNMAAAPSNSPAPFWNQRTLANHLATVQQSATIFRHTLNRLDHIHTIEHARADLLAYPTSCFLVFWNLACQAREPRSQPIPQDILRNLLSNSPSNLALALLRNAFAIYTSLRLAYHARTTVADTLGSPQMASGVAFFVQCRM